MSTNIAAATMTGENHRTDPHAQTLGTKQAQAKSVAITGSTGFIGRHLVDRFLDHGWTVRALARNPDKLARNHAALITIKGDLEDPQALLELTRQSSHVVHTAGVVAETRHGDFERVNVDGTRNLIEAAKSQEPVPDFILFSSLAARAPTVSRYAQSKCDGELLVQQYVENDHTIIRPPAVYGEGDTATLPLFEQMTQGFLITPNAANARFSLIHARDLAELTVRLCEQEEAYPDMIEPDDGRTGGYSWKEMTEIASKALNRNIRQIPLPKAAYLMIAALTFIFGKIRGKPPLLPFDKIGELFATDWVCQNAHAMPALSNRIKPADGFARTVQWYRHQGLLN